MTFEEWWKDKNNNLEMFIRGIFPNKYMDNARLVAKRFSEMAWQAAQPKWTYCNVGGNPEQDQRVNAIIKPEIKKNPLYVDTVVYRNGNYINERMCHFEDVIAWMPLPEAPDVHND